MKIILSLHAPCCAGTRLENILWHITWKLILLFQIYIELHAIFFFSTIAVNRVFLFCSSSLACFR